MTRISVYITFFLTHLSTWPSNWTIALKYMEGVSRFVTALKVEFIYSFSSFRKTERAPFCFLFESTSWRWQTVSFMIAPIVNCTSNKNKWVKENILCKCTRKTRKYYPNAHEKTTAKSAMAFRWSNLSIKGILTQSNMASSQRRSKNLKVMSSEFTTELITHLIYWVRN